MSLYSGGSYLSVYESSYMTTQIADASDQRTQSANELVNAAQQRGDI